MSRMMSTRATVVLSVLTILLGSGVLASVSNWALPTMMSTFYSVPNLEITVPTDLSYVSVSNTGHGTAHNVRITILAKGDQTASSFLFSSENATKEILYGEQGDVTLFTFQIRRMAVQASVSLELKSYTGETLEVWAQSDENGSHGLARRGFGLGQPDPVGIVTVSVTTLVTWFAFIVAVAIVVILAFAASRGFGQQVENLARRTFQGRRITRKAR